MPGIHSLRFSLLSPRACRNSMTLITCQESQRCCCSRLMNSFDKMRTHYILAIWSYFQMLFYVLTRVVNNYKEYFIRPAISRYWYQIGTLKMVYFKSPLPTAVSYYSSKEKSLIVNIIHHIIPWKQMLCYMKIIFIYSLF